MLRELGPDNPVVNGRVCIAGAVFFFIYGVFYKRIADFVQRLSGRSDRFKKVGIAIMRPLCFLMTAFCLYLAYTFLRS